MNKFRFSLVIAALLPMAASAQATKNAYDNVHREEEFKRQNRVTVMPQARDTVRHSKVPEQPNRARKLKKTDSALHMHR